MVSAIWKKCSFASALFSFDFSMILSNSSPPYASYSSMNRKLGVSITSSRFMIHRWFTDRRIRTLFSTLKDMLLPLMVHYKHLVYFSIQHEGIAPSSGHISYYMILCDYLFLLPSHWIMAGLPHTIFH